MTRPENLEAYEWEHYRYFVIKELDRLSGITFAILGRIETVERQIAVLEASARERDLRINALQRDVDDLATAEQQRAKQFAWTRGKLIGAAAGAGAVIEGLWKVLELFFKK